jgi:hypothetical protein
MLDSSSWCDMLIYASACRIALQELLQEILQHYPASTSIANNVHRAACLPVAIKLFKQHK